MRSDIEMMNPNQLSEGSRGNEVTLVICDAAGRILAISANAPKEIIHCSPVARQHFSEIFGEDSAITHWLTTHLRQGRREGDYAVEHHIENGSGPLYLRLENLICDQELYGFALTLSPLVAPASDNHLEEGDSVVYRKQWHEIKNYIGAMKLYATFLSKKLPDGDERQTIEKMLNGINNLIDYLARIRRGESK